mmetsp:Transcript_9429/g.35028  ORF Transcript_9429/g.35028 Transcript_9429/m.35028 type:complete len:91 (+) Transcript_9429:1161-1433(+)
MPASMFIPAALCKNAAKGSVRACEPFPCQLGAGPPNIVVYVLLPYREASDSDPDGKNRNRRTRVELKVDVDRPMLEVARGLLFAKWWINS